MSRMHIFLAFVIAITACATPVADTSPAPASPPAQTTTQGDMTEAPARSYAQNFKDMALAYCISKAYQSEPVATADAVATAGGLTAWTSYDLEKSTGEIPKLVDQFLARKYSSKQGPETRLDLLKCIDLYHSKELSTLVKRFVSNPSRTYRQDNPSSKQ